MREKIAMPYVIPPYNSPDLNERRFVFAQDRYYTPSGSTTPDLP
jgi:hypothetical protein